MTEVLLGEIEPSVLVQPRDVVSIDAATECIALADATGMALDAAQRINMRAFLGERGNGTWSAFQVCDIEPRQNGKGDKIQARELSGLFLWDERLIIHTAHEFRTANEAFLRMVALIKSNSELLDQVAHIRYANGEQGIELYNGARLKYFARTGGGGRGFTEADLVVYDEAFQLSAEAVAASLPTMTVSPNPQVWFASSAGLATSTAIHHLRRRALEAIKSGERGRFAYVERSAEEAWINDEGRLETSPVDPDDEVNVAKANAAYGWRITRDYVEAERDTMGDEKWMRERLGVWDPLIGSDDLKPPKLEPEVWARQVDNPDPPRLGELAVGFEVSRGSEWASVVVAWGTAERMHIELVAHDEGVGWLPRVIAAIAGAWKPRAVGCIGGGGSGAQVGPVMFGLEDNDLDRDLLQQVSGTDYRAGCEGLYIDLLEGRCTHRGGQEPFDAAALDATERVVGQDWAWEQRQDAIPICPMPAATVARHLLITVEAATATEVEPMFAFT